MVVCPSCRASFAGYEGPVHSYMVSSPGCWKANGEVLSKEYSDSAYWINHRLTVDAFAAQHPGDDSRQAIQSVGIHLMSLYLVLEANLDQGFVTNSLKKLSDMEYTWLEPPSDMGLINVGDVLEASSAKQHAIAVHHWARSVWYCWHRHHETIRDWVQASGVLFDES